MFFSSILFSLPSLSTSPHLLSLMLQIELHTYTNSTTTIKSLQSSPLTPTLQSSPYNQVPSHQHYNQVPTIKSLQSSPFTPTLQSSPLTPPLQSSPYNHQPQGTYASTVCSMLHNTHVYMHATHMYTYIYIRPHPFTHHANRVSGVDEYSLRVGPPWDSEYHTLRMLMYSSILRSFYAHFLPSLSTSHFLRSCYTIKYIV